MPGSWERFGWLAAPLCAVLLGIIFGVLHQRSVSGRHGVRPWERGSGARARREMEFEVPARRGRRSFP